MARLVERSLYGPRGGGRGGGITVFSGCMQNVFHSDGHGPPQRHLGLVYSSTSSE